jgi:hypothetical protein
MASLSEGSRQPKPGVVSAKPRWVVVILLAVLVVAALSFLVVLKAQ